jgi:protein-tyrosine sulfotransferase
LLSFTDNAKKYIDYVFDTKSFSPTFDTSGISDHAFESARQIRGDGRPPAVILHGIMPRSGTVYVGDLLRLHPDFEAFPYRLWEVPFLQLTGDMVDLQKSFLLAHRHNIGKVGENEFLPLFGAAFIAYLYSGIADDRRMLLKVPSVQYLDRFFAVFPYEHLLILTRDGRDVVQSTIKTWPQLRFSFVCRRWKRSARMVLECHKRFSEKPEGYWLARFEDAVRDPAAFVRTACERFGLEESRYPYDKINTIPLQGSSTAKRQGEVSWVATPKPQGFKPTGRWQQWSAGKKRTFKRIAGQELVDLGYCDDQNW